MAHTARQRPWTTWCSALLLCTLSACAQGRFLAEQKDALLDALDPMAVAPESNAGDRMFESTTLVSGSFSVSPFSWFQQQLGVFAAIEQAVMERLNEGFIVDDASGIQQDLLRHVGCARLRAALLNKAAQQGSEMVAAGSDGSATGGARTSLSSSDGRVGSYGYGYMDGEEYIEDYEGGSVSSRRAYASGVHLRGDSTGDVVAAAAAATSGDSTSTSNYGSSVRETARLSETRLLSADGYYADYYADHDGGYEGEGQANDGYFGYDASYGYEGEPVFGDSYSTIAYNDAYGYYEYDEDEDEQADGNELGSEYDGGAYVPVKQGQAFQQEQGAWLRNKIGMEGRALKPLEGPHALAYASQEAAMQGATKVVQASSSAATLGSAAEFGDDTYDLLDKADLMVGQGDLYDLYFGYEYDLYEDYYQAISLADVMLSKLDLGEDQEEWADYLEQAYEYFTFYMDIGDEYTGYAVTSSTSLDSPNALAALASIAELVVWAHMGSFVLEVRPTFAVSQIWDEDGSIDAAEADAAFLIAAIEPFSSGADFEAAMMLLSDEQQQQQPALELVNDASLRWVLPDGSLNWGLVTLFILAAGTAAMLVGFVASWMALRRSMRMTSAQGSWVFVPQRPAGTRRFGGSGGSGKGEKGWCEYGAPLVLWADDCKGAVCWGAVAAAVEDAAEYVSPKSANESVAKALCK